MNPLALLQALPRLGQLGVVAAIVAAIAAGGVALHHKIFQSGYDRAVRDVAEQNKEAVDAVNKARARVRLCNGTDGMRWDEVASECVRRD